MIQMLTSWGGLEFHSVHTLDTAEEARLVGLGLARYYSAGMDGQSALAGGTATIVLATQTISGTGLGAPISLAAVPDGGVLQVSIGLPTGSVAQAAVQVEDASNGQVFGFFFYPDGSGRRFRKPAGVTAMALRTTAFNGTGSLPVAVGA